MIVILNRDEIEEAIQAYVRDKLLPYGDSRVIHVTQERKVTAKVTFGEEAPDRTEALPGFDDLGVEEEPMPETSYEKEDVFSDDMQLPAPGTPVFDTHGVQVGEVPVKEVDVCDPGTA